jgi:hypothetical protein
MQRPDIPAPIIATFSWRRCVTVPPLPRPEPYADQHKLLTDWIASRRPTVLDGETLAATEYAAAQRAHPDRLACLAALPVQEP